MKGSSQHEGKCVLDDNLLAIYTREPPTSLWVHPVSLKFADPSIERVYASRRFSDAYHVVKAFCLTQFFIYACMATFLPAGRVLLGLAAGLQFFSLAMRMKLAGMHDQNRAHYLFSWCVADPATAGRSGRRCCAAHRVPRPPRRCWCICHTSGSVLINMVQRYVVKETWVRSHDGETRVGLERARWGRAQRGVRRSRAPRICHTRQGFSSARSARSSSPSSSG